MIHMTAHKEALLRDVIAAGDEGLPYPTQGHRYGLGDALGLALDGLIRADDAAQRLFVTSKGRAFAARTAA